MAQKLNRFSTLARYNIPVSGKRYTFRHTDSIPLLVPTVPEYKKLKKYLKQIDQNGVYSNFGPLNAILISRISAYLNIPETYIQTAANATLALEGAIRTSDARPGYWELPSWTFAATAHATINANVVPSFVDVALNTWRANFSDKVINVVDVLPFGDNLDLNRIPNQIETLVIDGAASILGLASCGMLPSSKKVALIVSMHATKLLPAGEGAFFVTNSEEWSRKFRAWTNFGFGFEREAEFIATNAKLSEYAAAVALAAFDNMKLIDLKMSGIRKTALKISQHAGISVQPSMNKGFNTPYWILNLYSKEAKEKVVKRLNENKIVNREWWGIGCHKQIAFSGNLKSKLPNTDLLASTTLGIPFHLALRERDFNLIGNVLAELP